MRFDLKIAIIVFLAVLILLAVIGYAGYDRWSDVVP
jgi:hypothetical protein